MSHTYGSFAKVKLSDHLIVSALLIAGMCGVVGNAFADDYDFNLHTFPNPFVAGQLYPNARSYAKIAFSIPYGGTASVYVYDFDGNPIRTLFEGKRYSPGDYAEPWDGRDDSGDVIAPGPYVVVLEAVIEGITYRDTSVAVANR